MFSPSEILIRAFLKDMRATHAEAFGEGYPRHAETIVEAGRAVLSLVARSNALYHDLDHTMTVALVGQDILRGRIVRDGDVSSLEWVHYIVSLLAVTAGFVHDVCPGDSGQRCVIDEKGTTLEMPRGATDAWLWPYSTDRAMVFVRARFSDHSVLDPEILSANIAYSRFPPAPDRLQETRNYGGLVRAAHFIGAVADPNFMAKMKPLFLELQESGIAAVLGNASVAEFRASYGSLYWNVIHHYTRDGADYLRYTPGGRQWLANMYAQVLAEEHNEPAMGAARQSKG